MQLLDMPPPLALFPLQNGCHGCHPPQALWREGGGASVVCGGADDVLVGH